MLRLRIVTTAVLISLSLSAVLMDRASARTYGEAANVESLIAADVDFREALGFEADPALVRDLYAHPERTTGSRDDGLLMTPPEARELQVRMELGEDAATIDRELSGRADWAGVAIDHLGGGKVALFLTDPNDTPDVPALLHPERLEVRSARFTLAQLEAESDFLSRAMADREEFMSDVASVSLDVLRNSVEVAVMKTSEAATFRPLGWFGPDAVRVVQTDAMPEPMSLHCDSNAPPVYGGLAWAYRNSSTCSEEWCTVGFEMQRDGYSGTDWVLTAGHCATTAGQSLYHWNVSFAWWRLTSSSSVTYQDFGLMEVKTTAGSISKVYWAGAKRQVSGASTSYIVGEVRCQTGFKTGYSVCGTILSNNSSCSVWTGFVKTTADVIPGDSGGPVYIKPSGPAYAVRANGIISCGNGTETWYPKWSNIPSGWGVHISLL